MSVTNVLYTTNSLKVTISSETSSTNIINSVNTAIANSSTGLPGAWSFYDTIAASTPGSGYSPIVTNVYRTLNVDATTYKYLILRFDTIKNQFYTSTCESWNASTHVATNDSWTGAGAFAQQYDIKDSYIFISCTPRHVVMWPFIRNEPGMWTGVFEFERIAAEDTAANNNPCFAWTSSVMLGTPWGKATAALNSQVMYAFPRTVDGFTGAAAAKVYAPVTSRGMFPPYYPGVTITTTVDANLLHLGSYYNVSYGWDGTKSPISPVSADAQTKSMPFGRMYNVGVTKNLGTFTDTIFANTDSTGGWPDPAGSNTELIMLPLNGGSEFLSAYSAGQLTLGTYGQGGAVVIGKPIAIGANVYFAASDGVRTWAMDSVANTSSTVVLSSANVTDLIFDGADYLYAATATGVTRIQVTNQASQISATLASGAAYLGIDQTYVYASGRTVSTTPILYMMPRSSFNSTPSSTSYTLGTAVVVATNFGTPVPDYTGLVYVATQGAGVGATQTLRVASVTAATASLSVGNTNPLVAAVAGNYGSSAPTFYIDPITNTIYLYTATSGFVGNMAPINPATLANSVAFTAFTGGLATQAGTYGQLLYTGAADYRGDVNIIPYRGVFNITPKRPGLTAIPSDSHTVILNSPEATTAGTIQQLFNDGANLWSTLHKGYKRGIMSHNGARSFLSDCVVLLSDNRIYSIKGYYNVTNLAGTGTGRLTIKG